MRDSFEAEFQEALQNYGRKNFSAAAAVCDRILSDTPGDADALYLGGLCQCRSGSPNIGVRLIKQAVSLKPELENFDIRRDWMIQCGITNQTRLWEDRYFEYRLFQVVDAFLISYPKCGRTWLRALLGKYVLGPDSDEDPLEVLELTAAHPKFSRLRVSHDDCPHWKPADRIYTNKQAYAGKKVVFLARDPRDTLVSYYFQYTRRNDRKSANDEAFDGSLSDFIRHDIGGLRSLVAFFNVWAANRHVPAGFLLVTYEDMIRDAGRVLRDVVEFLEWPSREDAVIEAAVAYCSFENMRTLEETNALNNDRLQAPDDRDPEGFKVRRGKVGGYTDYLTDDDVRYVDDYLRENLDDLFAAYKYTHTG